MTMMNDLTAYGRAIMDTLETGLADKVTGRLSELDADLPNLITDYAFGAVVGREGLDLKTREMLTVASLVSLGNACLLYTSPSPRDATLSRMPSSA